VSIKRIPEWMREIATYLLVGWTIVVGLWVLSLRNVTKTSLISAQNSAILDKMYLHIKEAESEKRGWLITGDDRYLGDYMAAITSVRSDVRDLNEYLRDRPVEKGDFVAASKLVDQKLDEMQHVVTVYKVQGRDAAFKEIANNKGYFLSMAIRDSVDRMKAQERNYIRHRMADIF
jgi:CHASE3 domain sensor protein